MKIKDLIIESISPEAALKDIVDIFTTSLPALYERLGISAQKMYDNNGSLKGLKLVEASFKSDWLHKNYIPSLNPALHGFGKSLPQNLRIELGKWMASSSEPGLAYIITDLFPLLKKIAAQTKNKRLFNAVQSSENAESSYENLKNKIAQDITNDEDSGYIDTPQKKPENIVGQQNAVVQQIIDDVLSRPEIAKYAGEIRNEIAKSDNKIVALKQALAKRNIKI